MKGHHERDYPEFKSRTEINNQNRKREERPNLTRNLQTWVFRKSFNSMQSKKLLLKECFILDSGANTHICGLRKKFIYLRKLKEAEEFEVETANEKLIPTHIGN